ncbi:MAG: protein kinase [Bryobacterales bacterium]|nr:protein kinase [Bryobacterales bacterium]
MTPERWRRIEEVFAGTAGMPADEVAPYLNAQCGDDAELRREVEALLRYDDPKDDSLLSGVVVNAAELIEITKTGVRQELASQRVGTRVGSYTLLKVIGFGGMGVVYLAERDEEGVRQKVAIKLVQQGRATKFIRDRFRQERQILARLDHQNIARFIDSGVTYDDLPYYVMEFVEDGETISEYCRKKNLSVEQRLTLFLQVCSAVNYAHRNLVVHRDLKPGNILVDKNGVLKLLDFGIAKVLSEDPAGGQQTQTVVRMLTPDYASPEQVTGMSITTATDVYSLGVILYELLADRPAHFFRNYSNTEIQRVVCVEDPVPPSEAALLAERTPEAKRRSRLVRGELDAIVGMSMRKEPNHRYRSVEQFMSDIENYLGGNAVMAMRGTMRYRVGKFVRKNRIPIAAAGLVAVTLLGGIAATAYQARRADRRFQQVRQLASTLMNDFDTRIATLPQSVELRQWMASTVVQYLDNLAADVGSDDGLQLELARGYYKVAQLQGQPLSSNLGQNIPSIQNYRKAAGILSELAKRRPNDAGLMTELCRCERMLGLVEAFGGNHGAAKAAFERGVRVGEALQERRPAEAHECLAGSFDGIVAYELRSANPRGATPFLNQQMEHANALVALGATPVAKTALAEGYLNLSWARKETGDPQGALEAVRRAGAIGEEIHGREGWKTSWLRFRVLDATGDIQGNPRDINLLHREEAVASYREALAIVEPQYARDPNDARARHDLDRILRKVAFMIVDDRVEEAMRLAERALSLSEVHLKIAPNSPEYVRAQADAYLIIGYGLQKLSRWKEALGYFERALGRQVEMQKISPEARRFLRGFQETYEATGDAYLQIGKEKEALFNYEKALELTVGLLWERPTDPYLLRDLSDSHEALAAFHAGVGRKRGADAKTSWKKAIELQTKSVENWTEWPRKVSPGAFQKERLERAQKRLADYRKAAGL